MKTYQIETCSFSAEVVVDNSGRIIQAAPVFKDTVGTSWANLAKYAKLQSWPVVSVVDIPCTPDESFDIQDQEAVYQIRVRNGRITQILKSLPDTNSEPVDYDTLPEDVKAMI